ncbi:protein embryonic gonad [Lucilia cuprina]|uniref:protein embryonic gonad n=1 Tax=Lucilia cuprina TaxID=7375 RepID=UPI001F052886|nr:protein embryonic gonad [Lucilia cuprina]
MNQLCKVCGEPAAGFHFGAFTCEGCKSFFGRTYNNISAIAGCKNNGDCVINKKNRTACKACRLRKCLLVGMSKSGSRYGRRSNWFKIHCLLQEQQTNAGNSQQNPNTNANNLEQLARLHQIHARQTYQDKTNPCIKSAIGQQQVALTLPASNAATANSFSNFLNPAKYFNGNDIAMHKNNESRLSDTPSDSGASSAGDPTDDCTSNNSIRQHSHHLHHQHHHHQALAAIKSERNCSSAHQSLNDSNGDEDSDERERRRQQFLQIFRSHSEPLSPFAPFHFTQLAPPAPAVIAGTPPSFVLPTILKTSNESLVKQEDLQEEPIDLSVKSRHSQTPECPRRSLTPEIKETNNEPVNVLTKTTPLDLTLVRTTQTLTG